MTRNRLGRRREQEPPPLESAEATLARVREHLQVHRDIARAAGGKDASISVAYVLDQLDPNGMWRLVRQDESATAPALPANIDAMTGCLPVTPSAG
jgi:hypothetical protein